MNTLTPLEYFAAHAPPPAEWFEPVFTFEKKPPQPEGVDWCDDCRADCGECRTPEACTQMREWQAKRRAIDRRNETAWNRAWMAQWPWVWAKMVLEAQPPGTACPWCSWRSSWTAEELLASHKVGCMFRPDNTAALQAAQK